MNRDSNSTAIAHQNANWVLGVNHTSVNGKDSWLQDHDWPFPIESISG